MHKEMRKTKIGNMTISSSYFKINPFKKRVATFVQIQTLWDSNRSDVFSEVESNEKQF